MSDFSADWLALRENADARARSPALVAALAERLAGRERVSAVDLGCGTGSTLRALGPHLPREQHWRLVDRDPALLAAARERLAAWADRARREGERLHLERDGRRITVAFAQADLTGDLPALIGPGPDLPGGPDLVAASALFDLCSPAWIRAFAAGPALRGRCVLAMLSYDGRETWAPPHPLDEAMRAAFHAHQGRDKGFGPAAGPDAAGILAGALAGAGFAVETGDSPWRLDEGDAALTAELARGVAGAVAETGLVPEADIAAWLAARERGAGCLVGHTDVLAWPPD